MTAACPWDLPCSLSAFRFLLSLSSPTAPGEDSLFFIPLRSPAFISCLAAPAASCSSFFRDLSSGEVNSSSVQTLHLHFLG